jgi:hypothetical protein
MIGPKTENFKLSTVYSAFIFIPERCCFTIGFDNQKSSDEPWKRVEKSSDASILFVPELSFSPEEESKETNGDSISDNCLSRPSTGCGVTQTADDCVVHFGVVGYWATGKLYDGVSNTYTIGTYIGMELGTYIGMELGTYIGMELGAYIGIELEELAPSYPP